MRNARLKIAILLTIIAVLLTNGIRTYAFVEDIISLESTTILQVNQEYQCDLNKDSIRETLRVTKSGNKTYLFLNGKRVLSVPGSKNIYFSVLDLNRKDSYGEIYVQASYEILKSAFYRYDGKKLNKLADGLYGDGYFLKKIIDNNYICDQPGNGTYIGFASVGGFVTGTGYNGYVPVFLKFAVKSGKMKFQVNAEHDVAFQYTQTASGTMVAYNTPSVKKAKKVFSLRKGDKYVFKKIKFSRPISFIQIKNLKTKKTGWIAVNAKQLKISYSKDLSVYFT